GQSWALNQFLGTGNARSFTYFFSKPPRENIMLTVVEDTTKNHWGTMGGGGSRGMLELRDRVVTAHRGCEENRTRALAPNGSGGDDIIDVFTVFMTGEQDTDENFRTPPSPARGGDYIDLRAEMNTRPAISACPADATPTNGYR